MLRALLLGAFALFPSAPLAAQALRAGVARVDLTPPLSMKPALGGYSARMSRPAEGVHDRVWAKALYLTDGKTRHATVTADVLGFPPTFKPALMAKLKEMKVEVDEVLLLPSHTHCSIGIMDLNPNNTFGVPQIGVFNKQVLDHALTKVAEAVRQASLTPVVVRVGTTRLGLGGFARNRRGGEVRSHLMTVTRIDKDEDGKPLAAFVHWAVHPVFLGSKDMVFSGDWPGHLQRELEALIGEGVTVMYMNGAQGDQSPTPRLKEKASGFEQAEAYGRDLALLAWNRWKTIEPQPNARLVFHIEEFSLPKRARHKDFMKDNALVANLLTKSLDEMLEKLFPEKTHSHWLRIGDLVIIGVPGELTAELGTELVDKSAEVLGTRLGATGAIVGRAPPDFGVRHVLIGGLADEWISYMLSEKEYERGGYEATVSYYGKTLGPTVVEATARGAAKLK